MGTELNKGGSTSRWVWTDAIKFILVFGVLGLSIYSNRLVSSSVPRITPTSSSSAIINVAPTSTQIPYTTTPAPTPTASDYRTVLLLERATDLIVTYIDKVQVGDFSLEDTSTRQLYMEAFPVAIDAYNKTLPPPGMSGAWNNVEIVASAYATVYPILQQENWFHPMTCLD